MIIKYRNISTDQIVCWETEKRKLFITFPIIQWQHNTHKLLVTASTVDRRRLRRLIQRKLDVMPLSVRALLTFLPLPSSKRDIKQKRPRPAAPVNRRRCFAVNLRTTLTEESKPNRLKLDVCAQNELFYLPWLFTRQVRARSQIH